ncbi:hypothetical protein [Candidatus Electronema sp. PJ]|uniref:hypothetical protein n=1 Tax=Candidatus Electronema sp. PJ TaxID=3401572 RepID=UPI003AA9AEA6
MEITDLILDYPKNYLIERTESEASAFDLNDKQQVIDLINELIPMILKKPLAELSREEQVSCGWVIEGVLECNFGYNFQENDYRDFVKECVFKSYERAKRNHDRIREGLRSLRK